MNESPQSHPVKYEDEIDIRELFRMFWTGKWIIASITVGASVIAVTIAFMLPNIYRAEALLAPNNQEGAGGVSALAAQYGGLASLAGINLGGGKADKTALGLEVLESRRFISGFVKRHDILVPLMASKKWDSETKRLILDKDKYDAAADQWITDLGWRKMTIPSMQEAHEEFIDLLSVRQDKETGFITLAVEHYSPIVAKQWVDWLIDDLNYEIMSNDVAEAEQAIQYLNERIASTPLSGLKEVFYSMIEEQTKTMMLARVSDEYLLKTIDPAIVPEEASKPRRALIVVLGTIFGLFAGILVVIISVRKMD
jgi:uncharacterized protein involved in exopolysaccharide biosynthesis